MSLAKAIEGEGRDDSSARAVWWTQLTEIAGSFRVADMLVIALILGFGALQFLRVERAADFYNDDVFFADGGRSLVDHGFYGINGYPETNQPPGLPWILGNLCAAGVCSHVDFLRVMVLFGTLAFVASYLLLRRHAPRIVAAAICLLLISSQTHFELVTRWVFPYSPYFFASMSALLIGGKLDEAKRLWSRIGWGALLLFLVVASLMFASAGIALLGAIVASISVICLWDRRLAFRRLMIYLPILVVGIVVQGSWMHKGVEASSGIAAQEWPVLGFPHSYVAQLKVKEGNHPELGMARPIDIPVRVLKNAYQRCHLLAQMLLHRSSYITWMSILVAGPLLLGALGWSFSVWPKGGGLLEWYFAGFEVIYLLWPWTTEARFFLPVAPLACLYAWRGLKALAFLAREKPRLLGAIWLPFAALLTAGTWFWMHGAPLATHLSNGGLQDEISFGTWLLSGLFALWLIWADTAWLTRVSAVLDPVFSALRINPVRFAQGLGIIAATGLVIVGFAKELKIGHENVDPNSETNRISGDAAAGQWINSHTDPNAVVMARQVPIVYHFADRKVIWFPPSSDPQLLMEGIRNHKIDFLVVVVRKSSYYLPPDEACFASLFAAHPDAFRLVCKAPEFHIYQVLGNAARQTTSGDPLPSAIAVVSNGDGHP